VVYRNVQKDSAAMTEMLALTKGRRDVPVVVDGGTVTIGHGGS
jgi:glutaredoxin